MKRMVFLVAGLLLCLTGCGSDTQFRYLPNDNLPEEFVKVVDTIYIQEDSDICIASFDKRVSPLKMISVQNLYGMHNINMLDDTDETNPYRYSVEKSIYENRNCVLINELSDVSCEKDYFEAYRVAAYIQDKELKTAVDTAYDAYIGSQYEETDEKIYAYLNHFFRTGRHGGNKEEIQKIVYTIIKEECEKEQFRIAVETLLETRAALAYLALYKDISQNKNVEKLYQRYRREENQICIIMDMDVCMEEYTCALCDMEMLLSEHETSGILYHMAEQADQLYQPLLYDASSPQNFACYMVAISYTGQTLSEEQYSVFKQIYEQIISETDETDSKGFYFLRLAAWLLKLDPPSGWKESEQKDYYAALYTGEKEDFEVLYDAHGNVLDQLYAVECSLEASDKKNVLKDISIFDYEQEEDFAVILNRYVICMLLNDCLSEDEEQEIREYLERQECGFGYRAYGGSYDFRTTVYYANILYILDGGMDIGLR